MSMVSLVSRWQLRRDGLLINPSMRLWLEKFLPTRWIARRRARALFDIVAGFVYSQVLAAGVRLNLFELLAAGPRTADSLARTVGLEPEAMQRLLDASISLQLIEPRADAAFGLGPLGVALVGNPGLIAMIEHHDKFYADLADPVALLRAQRGAQLSNYWAYARNAPHSLASADVADYSRLMSLSQTLVADQILSAYSFAQHRHLLDVGGGDGTFLRTVAQRWPHLERTLFDLPAVIGHAQAQAQRLPTADRAPTPALPRFVSGSFMHDPLPLGADVISLVRVLHDHDDEVVRHLLGAAWRALPAGGTLLIAEPMTRVAGARAMGEAYFGFYTLAMGQGRPRSAAQLGELLHQSQFTNIKQIATRMPLQTSLISAQRPR